MNHRMVLDMDRVKAIIEEASNCSHAVLEIYQDCCRVMGIPWEEVESIDPTECTCNKETWGKICRWLQDKEAILNRDRAYDKQVMPGGAWLQWGFSATGGEHIHGTWVHFNGIKLKEPICGLSSQETSLTASA